MDAPLKDARVIPDVIDDFKGSVELSVTYGGGSPLKNGQAVDPPKASSIPIVELNNTATGCLYTFVMTDPDAPRPDKPTAREWVHWIVTNIPAGKNGFESGQQILGYAGPTPPHGTHRYVLLAFEQPGGGSTVATLAPQSRGNFNTRSFAQDLGLKPVGAMYFTASAHE